MLEVHTVESSMNVVTKWRRVCSPSDTMSMPACSWSRSTSRTASRLPSARAGPSSLHGAHSASGSASQPGLGRLPAIVVRSVVFIGVPGSSSSRAGIVCCAARGAQESRGELPSSGAKRLTLGRVAAYLSPSRSAGPTIATQPRNLMQILYADHDYPDIDLEREIFAPRLSI